MNKIFTIITVLLFGSVSVSAQSDYAKGAKRHTYTYATPYDVHKIEAPKGKKIKNVIFMIGDGFSTMDMYSAWTANRGKLFLENATHTGFSKTYCNNKLITDSGAGGTALASGKKTNYHCVGVDPDGKPLKSILAKAHEKGLGTGVAVTCRLWDATPADYCCHNSDRDKEVEIIGDYPTCGVDYVFGGGAKYFTNRADKRDIFKELKHNGYATPRTIDEWKKADGKKIFAVPYPEDTPLPAERGDLLAQASLKWMDLLNKNFKNGFVMMIEGSQLDDYGHSNNLPLLMEEIFDFDKTVGKVMDWAAKDGETLVIVTADHETGGLTLVDGDLKEGKIVCSFSTDGHSGVMVPVYAFGPGAEKFGGFHENTDFYKIICDLLGF